MSSESSKNKSSMDVALTKKLNGFSSLLNGIDSLDEKTKILWQDIYFNAFNDRVLAQNLYDNLWPIVHGQPDSHAVHGPQLAKYIERMTRSNDQLIKLADLVEKAKEKDDAVDTTGIYGELTALRKGK